MRKKLFCGIAVFAMVFATCMSGFAQTVANCDPCTKCDTWHIPGNGCITLQQGQQAVLNVFDWDATYGYCEQQNTAFFAYPGTNNVAIRNCRMVFDICQCPEACTLEEGWVLGIQMEILTPGVYFATDPDVPMFDTLTPAPFDTINQAGQNCYSPNTYQLRFRRFTKAQASTPCTQTTFLSPGHTRYDTMKVAYYQNTAQANAGNALTWAQGGPGPAGERLAKVVRTPTPYDGWELNEADVDGQLCNFWYDVPAMIASGTITSGQHVEVKVSLLASEPLEDLITDVNQRIDYLRPANADPANPPAVSQEIASAAGDEDWLTGAPPYLNQGLYWENDCTIPAAPNNLCTLPGFNYDRDVLSHNDGDVDDNLLLGNARCLWRWDQKFCPDCSSPCSCTIDVGILCCEAAEGAFCLTFPYVVQGAADEDNNGSPDWATGIALSRLCDPAVNIDPAVVLTLTDCDGNEFTNTIANFGNCLADGGMTVDQMVSEYGWTPTAGQGWLQVESNFPIGGYQFNMFYAFGNMFGAGVLPIGCNACQLQ